MSPILNSERILSALLMREEKESEKAGLNVNIQKN